MIRSGQLRERMIVLFAVGVLAFNYPILSLFSVDRHLFGVPVLFVYIFSVWLALILLLALIVRAAPKRPSDRPPSGG